MLFFFFMVITAMNPAVHDSNENTIVAKSIMMFLNTLEEAIEVSVKRITEQ